MILRKSICIIISLLLVYTSSFAIEKQNSKNDSLKFDTLYIASYKDHFQVKMVGLIRESSIDFINNEEDVHLDFGSNNPLAFGVAIDYSYVTLEYTQSINGLEFYDSRKGETDTQALRFGVFGRKFSGEFYFRNSQGYNMENIERWVTDWFDHHERYPYSKDLKSSILSGVIYYTFNHKKYSTNAVNRQSERQLKSAGSPTIGLLYNLQSISSSTSIVNADSLLNKFLNIADFNYSKAGIFGGYMYTFTFNQRFIAHASLKQGFVYSFGQGEYHDTEKTDQLRALGISVFARVSLGYNGKKWFAGSIFSSDYFFTDVSSDLTTSTNYNFLKFYVGYRFPIKKRKWMKLLYL